MKYIPLTQGKFTIVDDEDFEWLNKHKWCAYWNNYTKSFYAARHSKRVNGKQYTVYMAREILGLNRGDKRQADHIDHNTLDNRRLNLRIVTAQQNGWNRKNAKGYSWNNDSRKFQAEIMVNGKSIYLGYFHIAKDARNAYLEAKKLYHKI